MSGFRDNRDTREGRGHERRRSRSPGARDRRDAPRGGSFRGRGDGNNRGHSNHHGGSSAVSNLPPLPSVAPFPEGTGAKVPFPNVLPRGTKGIRAEFIVNHHEIETLPIVKIYQYELRFRVPESSQLRGSDKVTDHQTARLLLDAVLVGLLGPDFIFDGVSNGWSPNEVIPVGESRTTLIPLRARRNGTPNEVEVSMRSIGTLDIGRLVSYMTQGDQIELNPIGNPQLKNQLDWLQAIFRAPLAKNMVNKPNSSAFYDNSPETTLRLQCTGGILQARRGVYQTMQIRFSRLTMNIDTATTAFYTPGLSFVECACALSGIRSPQTLEQEYVRDRHRFEQACGKLLGMFFCVKHLKPESNLKKIRVQSFSQQDAASTVFDEQQIDGTTQSTSVSDYYLRKYQIRLSFPMLPLARTRLGDFPLELCFSAADERYKEVLQGAETAEFIKFATAPAFVRRQQIGENLRKIAWHSQGSLRAHGLSVNPNMMRVKALVLPPPQLIYGDNGMVRPHEGAWNLRGLRFIRPATIKSWALISFITDTNTLERFGSELIKGFRACGMTIPSQPPALAMGSTHGDIKTIVQNSVDRAKTAFGTQPDVIFIILKESSTIPYAMLKNGLDVHLGIASQVMVADKALKCQPQYIANCAMKVNVKLGGTNCVVDEPLFKEGRWMLIGGDLSAGPPTSLGRISPQPVLAALTATWDRSCSAFTCVVSAQDSDKTNIIVNAKAMFKELLVRYTKRNANLFPEHIIYYRDGASESEFDMIRGQEGKILRQLCQDAGQKIKITLIVAVKRHHTRFFCDGPLATKLGNVPPGSVIENSSTRNDAFIVSQRDLQGTKRPTRYISIVDENNLTLDDFNRITYGMCSSYARATTSVAVVPPIYYADQACERARLHLQDREDGTKFLPPVHPNLIWNMYWQ